MPKTHKRKGDTENACGNCNSSSSTAANASN